MAKKKKTPPKKAAKKTQAAGGTNGTPAVGKLTVVPIDRIVRSPFQQRTDFPKAKVAELAQSIGSVGLLQPLVVRVKPGFRTSLANADWELIAGECRWRACKSLGHKEIRVEVWDVDDRACRKMVAAENFKRNDLNAIEEARTMQQAIDAGDASGPTELAKQYSMSQGHVSNRIRLLGLPENVQAKIISREIPPTHARSLIAFKDHPKLLDAILEELRGEQGLRKQEGPIPVDDFLNVVDNAVFDATASIGVMPHSAKLRGNVPKPKLTDEQREALGIITVDGTFNRKPVERATNLELWNKIVDEQEQRALDRAAKREGKGRGSHKGTKAQSGNGKAKRKLTPNQRKQADAEARERVNDQAAQFRRRLWAWYVDWLRWILARWIRDEAGIDQLLVVLLGRGGAWRTSTYRDNRMWQFDGPACLTESRRAAKVGAGSNAIADLVAAGDRVNDVATEYVSRCFHGVDEPSSLVPAGDVVALVKAWTIPIENDWLERQAGPHSEAYWNLHRKDQLVDLAKELKVDVPAGAKKPDLVKAFLAKIPGDADMDCGIALPKELKKIKQPR